MKAMKAKAQLTAAFGLAAVALVGWAASVAAGNLVIDTTDSGEGLVSTPIIFDFRIVNNTTSPAPASSTIAAGTLLYACGGVATLKELAQNQSVDIECSARSILYRVPGELGPHRLDFSCEVGEMERHTFTGSGSGVTSQTRCLAQD